MKNLARNIINFCISARLPNIVRRQKKTDNQRTAADYAAQPKFTLMTDYLGRMWNIPQLRV